MEQLAGMVLCGGRSQRMGMPKAWMSFGGQTLLARTVNLLLPVARPVMVVAAQKQELPPVAGGVTLLRDSTEYQGPLAGMLAGLSFLAECTDAGSCIADSSVAAFVTGCDFPLLRPEVVRRLFDLSTGYDATVIRAQDGDHPLVGVYRLTCQPVIAAMLSAGQRRLLDLLDHVRTRRVLPSELADVDPLLWSIMNVNDQAEFQHALRLAGMAADEASG